MLCGIVRTSLVVCGYESGWNDINVLEGEWCLYISKWVNSMSTLFEGT